CTRRPDGRNAASSSNPSTTGTILSTNCSDCTTTCAPNTSANRPPSFTGGSSFRKSDARSGLAGWATSVAAPLRAGLAPAFPNPAAAPTLFADLLGHQQPEE